MKKITAVLLSLSLLLLAGCGAKPIKEKSENLIAVSFYPIYIFTLNLVDGIEDIKVSSIAEQNVGCLHDYTVTAKDAKLLNDADCFVINGAGMEGFVEDLYETVDNLRVIDSSVGVELICSEGHSHSHDEHQEEHHEEHHDEHHDEHQEEHHGHHHSMNSHIWMSVKNAKKQVVNIKNGLAEIYPQYEKKLNENCEKYLLKLSSLEKEINEEYDALKGADIITFHNAYAYMAKDMGLNIVDCIEGGAHGGEPSAKKLAELTNEIQHEGVKALFTEPHYTGNAADILSKETGARVYVLNPVTSGDKTLSAYEDTMLKNIETIIEAVK